MANSLAFPDRWMREYGGSIEDVCETLSPVSLNDDEATPVVFELTLTQFNKLWSAIQTGAQLLWADEQYEIMWSFLKGVECYMSMCDRVAQCIYDSDAVRDALIWQLVGLGLLDGDGNPISAITGSSVTPAGTGCDDSDRYGMALAIVAAIDRLTTDMFETLTPSTDVVEVATDLLTIIPILGPLIAAAFNVAAFLITYGSDEYAAAYSSAVQSDIACALMCRFDDCELTFGNIMEGYRDLLGPFTPPGAFSGMSDLCNWLATVTLSTDLGVVCAVHYLILEAFSAGSTVNLAKPSLLAAAAYGADPVDPSGICDACEDCVGYLDGDGALYQIVPYNGYSATYNSTEDRYEAVWDHNHGSGKFLVVRTNPSVGNFNRLHLEWDVENTRSAAGVLQVIGNPGGVTLFNNDGMPPDGPGQITLDFASSYVSFQILLACRTWDDDPDAYAYLTRVEVCPAP